MRYINSFKLAKSIEELDLLLSPVHTAPFSCENGAILIRCCLGLTLLGCEDGAFRKS